MVPKNTIQLTNEFANGYDNYIADKKWSGPTVIFDLLKPFIKKNDSLLDLGIGTGLASIPFKNEGLTIYGIDSSSEMIAVCGKKQIAKQIFLSDLNADEFFFPEMSFDHVISNAFFHFIGNPGQIFHKVSHHLKKEGFFCFTILHSGIGNTNEYLETNIEGISAWTNPVNNLAIYRHTNEYINNLLKKNHFKLISCQNFLGFDDSVEGKKVYFNVFLTQRINY